MTEIRRADEAGHQMPVVLVEQFNQRIGGALAEFVRDQIEVQCQNMRGLRSGRQTTRWRKELLLKTTDNRLMQGSVMLIVFSTIQRFGGFGEQLRGISVIRRAGQVVWGSTEITALFGIQRHPVTKL
ncbi:hypothetical protein SRABI106_01781 [Rahnella aquatilis]|nr:hypothetical protein SRABI106_01781 [Rahnella aquatilis]